MKNVLSVRLDDNAMEKLRDLALKEGKEISAVARELIDEGWVLATMREYHGGKLSLGMTAERLGLSVSEVFEALAELGVGSPLEYEQYVEGNETARALMVRESGESKLRSGRTPASPKRNRRPTGRKGK